MAEIKRPNYFTSQFLVEKDFNDEQAYHLSMRRRLNRVQHTSGVADGFAVTRVSATQVQVGAGTAMDKDGREIVFEEAQVYTLATAGNNLDVHLTLSYQEVPVDHYNQAGIDKFTRTAERPLLQDGTAVPPTDGSVILLARIRLSASGAIVSDGSIDTTVRTLAGARLTPKSVGAAQLADGAVTLAKLADEALPLAVQGTNAITVATDTVLKKVTVGESHSALTNNPHATTALQIDTQGGTNRLVAQINAGTGIVARGRVETSIVTGVVTFTTLTSVEQFSEEIDPGLGAGVVCVQLAIDEVPAANLTVSGDTGYGRTVNCRAEVNRTTGRFRIFAQRQTGTGVGTARVRWHAFKPVAGADASVSVSVTVTPSALNMAGNAAQQFTATVANSSNAGVTWSVTEAGGGSLSALTPTTVTYTSPGLSGTYHVNAVSIADVTKVATATITVTAAIAVNLSQTAAQLLTGGQVTLNASVINTGNTGITWSILNNAGGALSSTSGASTTYTAPSAPGSYTVVATSVADATKKANCVVTVSAVTISVGADSAALSAGESTTVRATITPGFADNRANWTVIGGGTLSTTQGATAGYTARVATNNSSATITGTSVADPTKSSSVTLSVGGTGGGPGPGPGPGGPGPGGKFSADEQENIMGVRVLSEEEQAPLAPAPEADAKARTFVTPQKRPKAKKPSEPDA